MNGLWKGLTPLHIALFTTSDPYWYPYTELVYTTMYYLLDAGANPNMPIPQPYSSSNSTPLFWVSYDGRADMVARMIQAGADVNHRNALGYTALHRAAACDFR